MQTMRFQIEMVLPADFQGSFDAMIRLGESLGQIAALNPLFFAEEGAGRDGLVDAEDRLAVLRCRTRRRGASSRAAAIFGRDDRQRLAEKTRLILDQQQFILDGRAKLVLAGNVAKSQHGRHAGQIQRRRDIQTPDSPVRHGAGHDAGEQFARQRGNIVQKLRFSAHVSRGRIMRNVFSHNLRLMTGTPART